MESEKTATKVETILKWAQDAGKDTGKLSRESLRKGRISTVDLLVLDNLDQQLAVFDSTNIIYFKMINEEVNGTETYPSVIVPCCLL